MVRGMVREEIYGEEDEEEKDGKEMHRRWELEEDGEKEMVRKED